MSYTIQDRNGGQYSKYMPPTGTTGGGAKGVWWPDYGPSTRDFTYPGISHPTETIHRNCVEPLAKRGPAPTPPPGHRDAGVAPQFRKVPPREALMQHKQATTLDQHLAAHAITTRNTNLRRSELQQRRMDACAGASPICPSSLSTQAQRSLSRCLPEGAHRSRSEGQLSSLSCAEVSRDVYAKHGFTSGFSKESTLAAKNAAKLMKKNPMNNSMMVDTNVVSGRPARLRKRHDPPKPWRVLPESNFVFDTTLCLPVLRPGRGLMLSQPPMDAYRARQAHSSDWAASGTVGDTANGDVPPSSKRSSLEDGRFDDGLEDELEDEEEPDEYD